MAQLGEVPGGDEDDDTRPDVGAGDDEEMGNNIDTRSHVAGRIDKLGWNLSDSEEEQEQQLAQAINLVADGGSVEQEDEDMFGNVEESVMPSQTLPSALQSRPHEVAPVAEPAEPLRVSSYLQRRELSEA